MAQSIRLSSRKLALHHLPFLLDEFPCGVSSIMSKLQRQLRDNLE